MPLCFPNDRQPVLKVNNYDLENGEPSVFDRELNKDVDDEGALGLAADVKQEARPVQKGPKKPRKPAQSARPVHVDNPMQAQNRQLKAEREEYRARRALFMSQHKKVRVQCMATGSLISLTTGFGHHGQCLKLIIIMCPLSQIIQPFMSEKAFVALKARAAAAEKFVHPALTEGQPASIKVMRAAVMPA